MVSVEEAAVLNSYPFVLQSHFNQQMCSQNGGGLTFQELVMRATNGVLNWHTSNLSGTTDSGHVQHKQTWDDVVDHQFSQILPTVNEIHEKGVSSSFGHGLVVPNSVQIAATDSEHVEPDPSDNLPSKQDGSEQMPLLNDHDSNHSGNITNFGSEDVAQQLAIGTGDGATNSLPIKPRDGGQVESHPSVILSGKQHGSGPITSQNQPEGNPSPNITTFCDQVVAPPWPKGYGPSICFALSLFCRMVKFLWLQIQNNYGDN